MNPDGLWQVFLETGAPEVYLLFNKLRKMEEQDVFNGPGVSSPRNNLQ